MRQRPPTYFTERSINGMVASPATVWSGLEPISKVQGFPFSCLAARVVGFKLQVLVSDENELGMGFFSFVLDEWILISNSVACLATFGLAYSGISVV